MRTWQRPSWREVKIRLHQAHDADVLAVIEAIPPGERQAALVRALRAGFQLQDTRVAATPAPVTADAADQGPNPSTAAVVPTADPGPPDPAPTTVASPQPHPWMKRLAQAELKLFGRQWPPEYLEPDTRTPEEIERDNEEWWDLATRYDPYTGRKREGPPPPRPGLHPPTRY
ncbi:MAG: hypothetical protein K6V97_11250 [Actinomycetia bacterium]|nr:hypothetical protein [Actinomycetes bacterium]